MLRMTSATMTTIAADDVPGVLPQRAPEDREVVRDEERRRRDRDDVDEHLRPRRPERDQLVERVAGEAGGAAGLREPHRPLGVRGRSRREDDACDDEDDRRQPERIDGGEAERVVDRGADVPVRGGEERRRTENALELDLPSTSAGHRSTLDQERRRERRERSAPSGSFARAKKRAGVSAGPSHVRSVEACYLTLMVCASSVPALLSSVTIIRPSAGVSAHSAALIEIGSVAGAVRAPPSGSHPG